MPSTTHWRSRPWARFELPKFLGSFPEFWETGVLSFPTSFPKRLHFDPLGKLEVVESIQCKRRASQKHALYIEEFWEARSKTRGNQESERWASCSATRPRGQDLRQPRTDTTREAAIMRRSGFGPIRTRTTKKEKTMVCPTNDDWPIRLGSECCFYCSNPIMSRPFIEWLGHTEIVLHPACAVDFCLRLLRDVHEIECRYCQRANFCREDVVTHGDRIVRTQP